MPRSLQVLTLVFLLGVGSAWAQEFWLQPPRFFVTPGEKINLHVFVGDNFTGRRWTGTSSRLTSFVHYAPTDSADLTTSATRTDTLATTVELQQPGVHLLSFSTTNAFTELDATRFNAYLQASGLENIIYLRQRRNETSQPGRELYRRCAKTLVQVGTAGASAHAHRTGQDLEIVPEQNPYNLRPEASLTCLVLYKGRPLPAARVQVWQQGAGQPARVSELHANKNGRVLFRLSNPGNYLVSTVHMEPAADRKIADWQSTWATLTFGFGSRP